MEYYNKFQLHGKTIYGVLTDSHKYRFSDGCVVLEDAVLPKSYRVKADSLIGIEMEPSVWNPEKSCWEGGDEYTQFVQNELSKARAISESLGEGIHVGSMFVMPVGDGRAYYVVTHVGKRTCRIEWRGFSEDRWVDRFFGYGGSFNKSQIERML